MMIVSLSTRHMMLVFFLILMAFKSVTSHTNCVESSERCKSNPVSCVPERVRSRIESLVSREDFHFIEDDQKHSLPYGCYLSLEPKVPYHDNCEPCARFCNLTEKPAEEDSDTTKEMCQLYCWEDRERCTTTPDAKPQTKVLTTIQDSLPSELTSAPPLLWKEWLSQAVSWTALGIGLATLVGFFGLLVYILMRG